MLARARSRFLAVVAVLAAAVMLTGCLTTRVNPGDGTPDPTPFTSPAGTAYDWLWLSWTEEMADNAIITTGAHGVWVAVCFPALGGPWPRMYFYGYTYGQPTYVGTTAAGCTNWMQLAHATALPQGGVDIGSNGWQRLAGIGAGETVTVHLLFEPDPQMAQPQDVWTSVRVANEAHTTVWYESL